MREVLKFLLGAFVLVVCSYGAYMVPEWTGVMAQLDSSGGTPWFLQWFLGMLELVLIVCFLAGSYRIGEAIWDHIS